MCGRCKPFRDVINFCTKIYKESNTLIAFKSNQLALLSKEQLPFLAKLKGEGRPFWSGKA